MIVIGIFRSDTLDLASPLPPPPPMIVRHSKYSFNIECVRALRCFDSSILRCFFYRDSVRLAKESNSIRTSHIFYYYIESPADISALTQCYYVVAMCTECTRRPAGITYDVGACTHRDCCYRCQRRATGARTPPDTPK